MCGVAGIFHLDGSPVNDRELRAMARLQAHRGPDGEKIYLDGALGLAHRRLAIIDPTAPSDQPFSYADGRYRLVFNGEIYNFLELRDELTALGCRFRTDGDTEVLAAAYAQWGEDCQLKFNGMWAFAIWDRDERTLFLSRDRFAVKPLHYIFDGSVFAFSSEIKGFLGLAAFDPRFEPAILSDTLCNYPPQDGAEETLFVGVRRLRGGCSLTVSSSGGVKRRRWWRTLAHRPEIPTALEAQAEMVRALLMDAVALRMRSDAPLATALSGGFDSSAVHCAMAALNRRHGDLRRVPADRFKAFIAGFPGTAQEERSYALAVTAYCGTQALVRDESPENFLDDLPTMIYHQEAINNAAPVQWLLYRDMRREGIRVSLDGHGGDELFAGYHHYARVGREASANPETAAFFDQILADMSAVPEHREEKPSPVNAFRFLVVPGRPPVLPDLEEDAGDLAQMDPINRRLYLDLHYLTLPNILQNFDRASMAHGIEVRAPFLDWRLVTAAMAMPWSVKIAQGYTKYVARLAMGALMPITVVGRKTKLGYVSPMESWLPGPLRQFVLDLFSEREFISSPLWNGRGVRAAMEAALDSGDRVGARNLWPFVQAHVVMKEFRRRCSEVSKGLAA